MATPERDPAAEALRLAQTLWRALPDRHPVIMEGDPPCVKCTAKKLAALLERLERRALDLDRGEQLYTFREQP